jgi:Fic family protein
MTARTVQQIAQAQREIKVKIRDNYQFYSKDLVDVLFLYPYTRIQHLQDRLKISRQTASNYLNKLSEGGILEKMQLGKHLFFINKEFFDILSQIPCDVDKNVPEIITDDGK